MENLLPAVKSISDLINDFESGKIAVPEIQQQRLRGHPLARLRRCAAEQQEVTWRRVRFGVKGARRSGSRKPSRHWCFVPVH
jgi:hypothetical protein